jgi:hypothetical protein
LLRRRVTCPGVHLGYSLALSQPLLLLVGCQPICKRVLARPKVREPLKDSNLFGLPWNERKALGDLTRAACWVL